MLKSKKYIIITITRPPSHAVELFCQWPGWTVIIVGDRKTSKGWSLSNAIYLELDEQHDFCCDLAGSITKNTSARYSLGYAYAMSNGATAIFKTHDDNIPYQHACSVVDDVIDQDCNNVGARLSSLTGWINIYRHFEAGCWPRCFLLRFACSHDTVESNGADTKPWAVTQFLAYGAPDVDAIYRLIDGLSTRFATTDRFTLDEAAWCPFNSQTKLWLPRVFPFMSLPVEISARVTDILHCYLTTANIWRTGNAVSFARPVVYQDRNAHDLLRNSPAEPVALRLLAPQRSLTTTVESKSKNKNQLILRLSAASTKTVTKADYRKRQTATATPAKPGNFSVPLGMRYRCILMLSTGRQASPN